MKTVALGALVLLAGLGVGGGGAIGVTVGRDLLAARAKAVVPPTFLATGPLLMPLVLPDGRLTGYVSVTAQLEVDPEAVPDLQARLPLLLHAVNLRAYRQPLAAGPDGMLPDIEGARRLIAAAAGEAFGPKVVRRVAVTQAVPG